MTASEATHAKSALLTPAEVAAAFRVDPKTVTRWAKAGKLKSIRTLGGHRRYLESEILTALSAVDGLEQPPLWVASRKGQFRAR